MFVSKKSLTATNTNSLLTGAFIKAFGEVMNFGDSKVKCIHMVNVRPHLARK